MDEGWLCSFSKNEFSVTGPSFPRDRKFWIFHCLSHPKGGVDVWPKGFPKPYILSSWVRIRFYTKPKLPRLPSTTLFGGVVSVIVVVIVIVTGWKKNQLLVFWLKTWSLTLEDGHCLVTSNYYTANRFMNIYKRINGGIGGHLKSAKY